MKRQTTAPWALLALLLSACGGGAAEAPAPTTSTTSAPAEVGEGTSPDRTYTIQLHRPLSVGDQNLVAIEVEEVEQSRGVIGDRVVRAVDETVGVTLGAIRTVESVDDSGEWTRARFVIVEATLRDAEGERSFLEEGQTLIVDRGGEEPTMELSNGDLTDEIRGALGRALSLQIQPESTDDIFGTPDPQPVGASWDLNLEQAARGLSRGGKLRVTADQLAGRATLVGLEQVHGIDCLRIGAEMAASELEIPDVPPGSQLDEAELAVSFDGCFPTAASMPRVQGSHVMTARFRMIVPTEEGPMEMAMQMRKARASVVGPMPE